MGFSDGAATVEIRMTISAGISAFPIDGNDANELMRKADGADYRAKVSGRNKIVLSYEERMAPKTSHFTSPSWNGWLPSPKNRMSVKRYYCGEALDDLLVKYQHGFLPKQGETGRVYPSCFIVRPAWALTRG